MGACDIAAGRRALLAAASTSPFDTAATPSPAEPLAAAPAMAALIDAPVAAAASPELATGVFIAPELAKESATVRESAPEVVSTACACSTVED